MGELGKKRRKGEGFIGSRLGETQGGHAINEHDVS